MLRAVEAELLDASGRREEALAVYRTLKRGDPEDLSPSFMSAFTLEALGRYRVAAAEWRYIIGWTTMATRLNKHSPGKRHPDIGGVREPEA